MAFVRHKTVKGRKYYQYVRNYREGGQHKQEVLYHLGRHDSLDSAIHYEKQMMLQHWVASGSWEKEASSAKSYLHEFYGDELGGKIPKSYEALSRWELFQEDFDRRTGWLYRPNALTDEEWEAEWRRWEVRWRYEKGLFDSVLDYHDANWKAYRHRRRGNIHYDRLNRLTALQQKYS
jgi:hypothetical protein